MKILFQNMMLLTPGISTRADNRNFKDERIEYFLNHVLDQYDVLCLSEVWKCHPSFFWRFFHKGFDRRDHIIRVAESKGYVAITSPAPGPFNFKVIDGGLLVLTRLPIVRAHAQSFGRSSPTSVEFCIDNGFCHVAVQDMDGSVVNIITGHLESDHTILFGKRIAGWGKNTRSRQLQMVLDYIETVSTSTKEDGKYPWIIGGDLNIDANEQKRHEFDSLCELLGEKCKALLDDLYYAESTLGDIDDTGEPMDNVLTHFDDLKSKQFVDHAFVLCTKTHRDSSSHHHHKWRGSIVKIKNTRFPHLPFRQISDHHGILVEKTASEWCPSSP